MEVIIHPTPKASSHMAARYIAKALREKPNMVIGLAAGRTPLILYNELIKLHKEGLDFSGVKTFNLDEYVGLAVEDKNSYSYFMQEYLLSHINIKKENVFAPDGMSADIAETCRAYEKSIEELGGIDLQILGIGSEGHIGFNEPTSSLASNTRIKTLAEKTVKDNAPHFGSEEAVPKHVITMGIGTIMRSRCVVLLAFGDNKANVMANTIEGPITSMVPASILQHHQKAKIFIDDAASSELRLKPYYKAVFDNKPAWQEF